MRCNPAAVSWIAADNRLRYLPALSLFLIIAQSLRAKRANTLVVKNLKHPPGTYTMPQGVIASRFKGPVAVLSLPAQAEKGCVSPYPLEILLAAKEVISAARSDRRRACRAGEDLEPTASGWGHLHLRIYARRRTNHSVGLRELVAQRLGVASLSGGWRLTLSARWTCNALLRRRLVRCRRLRGSRTDARQRCNK